MKVMGITDLSTVDWPGKAATIIFFFGCPLACPRCHNKNFLGELKDLSRKQIVEVIKENSKVVDAVIFSGGEASQHAVDLSHIGREAKDLGLMVGIETSGIYPNNLNLMLESNALDKVFLDVKGPLYEGGLLLKKRIGNTMEDPALPIARSLTHIIRTGTPLELRMTVFPDYPDENEIKKVFRDIGSIFLMNKRPIEYRLLRGMPIDGDFKPLSMQELADIAARIEKHLWGLGAKISIGAK
jgi:pyruvate formate lyase activating enzyme